MTDTEIEIRARYKQKRGGKIVFIYIAPKKAFKDAKVCACLCIGGPVKYRLKEGLSSSITQEWLFEHVVPRIRQRYSSDNKLCNVLGIALLYACMSDEDAIVIPDAIRIRVRNAYSALNLEVTQPVEKVPLHVYRIRDQLFIDPIEESNLVRTGPLPGADNAATDSANNKVRMSNNSDAIQTFAASSNALRDQE